MWRRSPSQGELRADDGVLNSVAADGFHRHDKAKESIETTIWLSTLDSRPYALFPSPAISRSGHLTIEHSPKGKTAGQMQQWGQRPKKGKSPRQIAHRGRAPVTMSLAVNNNHRIHELVVVQIRILFGNLLIVQGKIGEPLAAVPPMEQPYLPLADSTVPIVNHHIGPGPLVGRGERGDRRTMGRTSHQIAPIGISLLNSTTFPRIGNKGIKVGPKSKNMTDLFLLPPN